MTARFSNRIGCAALLTVSLCLVNAALVRAEQISVTGSPVVKSILDEASKEYQKSNPGVEFVIGVGGTDQGVKLAGQGEVQIGMASRFLKDNEKSQYPKLVEWKLGMDGTVVVLNQSNPVKQLTSDQVVGIYTGKITNWKEVGGNDAPIAPVTLNKKYNVMEMFCKHVKMENKADGATLFFKKNGDADFSTTAVKALDGHKAVLAAAMTDPNGITFTSYGLTKSLIDKGSALKMTALDGVEPTAATIADKKYGAVMDLVIVTNGQPTGELEKFVKFLTGGEGTTIVKSLNLISTPAPVQ